MCVSCYLLLPPLPLLGAPSYPPPNSSSPSPFSLPPHPRPAGPAQPEQYGRTRIIPHGLNPRDFKVCPDGGYFLWVAALDWGWEEKGLHIFVELARRHPEKKFVAYGHAQKRPEVLERLQRETAGLPNFVYGSALMRGQEHMDAFCGATAFFMPTQPSIGESFGLTVIEALSKGVPVITSTAGAPAEILGVPGRHGIVEVGAACSSIEEYDLALRKFSARTPELSARVQAFAAERYSSHVVVDEMLGLTMDLLRGATVCDSVLPEQGAEEGGGGGGEGRSAAPAEWGRESFEQGAPQLYFCFTSYARG